MKNPMIPCNHSFLITFFDVEGFLIDMDDFEVNNKTKEEANILADMWGEHKLPDFDANKFEVHEWTYRDADVVDILVNHLEMKGYKLGWGSLKELVINWYMGISEFDLEYFYLRYETDASIIREIINELDKFKKWRNK